MILDEKSKKQVPRGAKIYDEVEFNYTYLDDSNLMSEWIPKSENISKSK